MAVVFSTDTDDDGTGTTGTIHNNAWKQAMATAINQGIVEAFANTETGTQNDWAPAGMPNDGEFLILWSGASALTVTGVSGGATGQRFVFKNIGAAVASFSYDAAGSSAANRFRNMATSAGTPVAPGGCVIYQHDGARWAMVSHDQGAGITPTFAAGDFTALTAGTWTVASGDVGTMRYHLRGKCLTVQFTINTTTVAQSGANPTVLLVSNAQWGGFTGAAGAAQAIAPITIIDNGTWGNGYVEVLGAGSVLRLIKNQQAQWATATDTTYVWGTVAFEVT
jgi:hypothetical protein